MKKRDRIAKKRARIEANRLRKIQARWFDSGRFRRMARQRFASLARHVSPKNWILDAMRDSGASDDWWGIEITEPLEFSDQ